MMLANTRYGTYSGIEKEGCTVFLGIPYAKAPVGALRWKAPVRPDYREGVTAATEFGCRAMQPLKVYVPDPTLPEPKNGTNINYGREFYDRLAPMSEDCLYLNVTTPAKSPEEKLPVAVWIHGGAFRHGSGDEKEFDGEAFAARGVIYVSINYRLGIFGFLTHPLLAAEDPDGHCGNYGILDQLAALSWVKENISAFGGDPERVTVFGQSAGAMSVQTLVSSPLSKGLISGAIAQSGAGYRGGFSRSMTMEQLMPMGTLLSELSGCDTLEALRAIPAEELLETYMPKLTEAAQKAGVMLGFTPCVDGYVLPVGYDECLASGMHPDIPYMLGFCSDDLMKQLAADGAVNWSLLSEELGRRPNYIYEFAHRLPGDESGAFHSAELWYVFGTLSRCWRPMTEADYELSERMCSYWCNFVKNGDPNGAGLPVWEPLTKDNPVILKLDIK